MIKELIKLATHLDERGLVKEADYLDSIIKKIAREGVISGSNWGYVGNQLQRAGAPQSIQELKNSYSFHRNSIGLCMAVLNGTEGNFGTPVSEQDFPSARDLNHSSLGMTRTYFQD
jgi:hypothetical protein